MLDFLMPGSVNDPIQADAAGFTTESIHKDKQREHIMYCGVYVSDVFYLIQ